MTSTIDGRSEPTLYTDRWREDNSDNAAGPPCGDESGSGGWGRGMWCETISGCLSTGNDGTSFGAANARYLIRGAAWEVGIVGAGTTLGNLTSCQRYATHITEEQVEPTPETIDVFDAAPDIAIRTDFFDNLTDYGSMTADQSLNVGSDEVYVASNGGNEFIAYVLQAQAGATFQLNLSTATGSSVRDATWHNTTTGATQAVTDTVTNGAAVTLTPPSSTDWALHIRFGEQRSLVGGSASGAEFK
jgi:hypothetical protein